MKMIPVISLVALSILALAAPHLSAAHEPEVVVRRSSSQFAAFRSTGDEFQKRFGSEETIDVVRTAGYNCRQSGFPNKECDMCCNGECCEDPKFWPAPLESVSLKNAQAWIPLRFAFIVPSNYDLNLLPNVATQKQLLGRVNAAFRYFPLRFLYGGAHSVFNDSSLHKHCSTDPCFTDPNCGFLKYIVPNVSMSVHSEIVITVCEGLSYLGEAQFPWAPAAAQYVQIRLKDFSEPPLVHELGHYVGLMHVFAGECSTADRGDWVDDTRWGKDANNDCAVKRDSCPGDAGHDDIVNFMNYGLKWTCGLAFTEGQAARGQAATERYRPLLIQNTRVSLATEKIAGSTQTPACAMSAETFEDCWCAKPELDPRTWCTSESADGKRFTQQATWAPPSRTSAGKIEFNFVYILALVFVSLLLMRH